LTRTSTFAGLALAVLLTAAAAPSLAVTGAVQNTPVADPPPAAAMTGFTVTSPALLGGPSATDYYAYYDGDGPNLPGLIRSYDDYSRYADPRGVAAASTLDASVMPRITDDPGLTAIYGEFDYMFAIG
jgi:hypothetical protein